MKKDNTTFLQKVTLRRRLLQEIKDPRILETHGGYGKIYSCCYSEVENGCVFEVDEGKAESLTVQRPTWSVYQSDCVKSMKMGVPGHLEFNFIDVDPYGSSWPAIDAVLSGSIHLADKVAFAVNDGLRQKLRIGSGWEVKQMAGPCARYGNANLFFKYEQICRDMMQEKSSKAGYALEDWVCYYCGHNGDMTHFGAVLRRK